MTFYVMRGDGWTVRRFHSVSSRLGGREARLHNMLES
jgi:hypothetical protein